MLLRESNPELPTVFKSWCDCGWQGRMVYGVAYVIGMCYPIEDYRGEIRCPKCNKHLHKKIQLEDFEARFRFIVDNYSCMIDRHGDVFPCTCSTKPSCRIVSEIVINAAICGDTCFVSDDQWIRSIARVKCNGCHAEGKIAWIEKVISNDFWREEWVNQYPWQQMQCKHYSL